MKQPAPSAESVFLDPGRLRDGELTLQLARCVPADPRREWVPAYIFSMRLPPGNQLAGSISLRLGRSEYLRLYAGQVGYTVEPPFRGQRLAARSLQLILPLARRHGLNPLWVTCNPDNIASRKTCERAGGEFVDIVDVPENTELYQRGDRQKCRYRFDL
ncbi:MAG: GNAT family N-acetyltransferase [Opitutales bacterium]